MPFFTFSKRRSSLKHTTTILEPKIEPPEKSRAEGHRTRKRTTSESQPMTQSPTTARHPTRKSSTAKDASRKHATSKNQPKESEATAKNHHSRMNSSRKDGSKKEDSKKDDSKKDGSKKDGTRKDGTVRDEPTTKSSTSKDHPTTDQPTNESQRATKVSDIKNQSVTEVPTVEFQPTELPQIALKIIRIPWDRSPMTVVTIPLRQNHPLGSADASTTELEDRLKHIPNLWDNFKDSFCWRHRELHSILTRTDLRTLSQDVLDEYVTPDNLMYICHESSDVKLERNLLDKKNMSDVGIRRCFLF